MQIPAFFLWLLGGLTAFDLVTKLIVYYALPYNEAIPVLGNGLFFYVLLNQKGINPLVENISQNNQSFLIAVAVISIALAVYVFLSARFTWQRWQKALGGVGLYLILAFIAVEIAMANPIYSIDPYWISLISRLGSLSLFIAALFITKDKFFRLCWTLVVAGGIGNTLSSLYPPFQVIDFIGTGLTGQLIFNFADIYALAGYLLIIVSPIVLFIRKRTEKPQKNVEIKEADQ